MIHDVDHLDAHTKSLAEKSTAGTNMVNYELTFADGEGSFEEMQMDMYNSPITTALMVGKLKYLQEPKNLFRRQ